VLKCKRKFRRLNVKVNAIIPDIKTDEGKRYIAEVKEKRNILRKIKRREPN
jgi:hypothetical protein